MILIEKINDPKQLNLSVPQKKVIAIVLTSPTPKIAHDRLNELSLLLAASSLSKLGVLSIGSYRVELTPIGMELAQLSNLVDQSGELTQDAKSLINIKESRDYKILSKMIFG